MTVFSVIYFMEGPFSAAPTLPMTHLCIMLNSYNMECSPPGSVMQLYEALRQNIQHGNFRRYGLSKSGATY